MHFLRYGLVVLLMVALSAVVTGQATPQYAAPSEEIVIQTGGDTPPTCQLDGNALEVTSKANASGTTDWTIQIPENAEYGQQLEVICNQQPIMIEVRLRLSMIIFADDYEGKNYLAVYVEPSDDEITYSLNNWQFTEKSAIEYSIAAGGTWKLTELTGRNCFGIFDSDLKSWLNDECKNVPAFPHFMYPTKSFFWLNDNNLLIPLDIVVADNEPFTCTFANGKCESIFYLPVEEETVLPTTPPTPLPTDTPIPTTPPVTERVDVNIILYVDMDYLIIQLPEGVHNLSDLGFLTGQGTKFLSGYLPEPSVLTAVQGPACVRLVEREAEEEVGWNMDCQNVTQFSFSVEKPDVFWAKDNQLLSIGVANSDKSACSNIEGQPCRVIVSLPAVSTATPLPYGTCPTVDAARQPELIPVGQGAEFFCIHKTTITVTQYKNFDSASTIANSDEPIVEIDWDTAQAFCASLNTLTPGYEFSLPGITQWEAAQGQITLLPTSNGSIAQEWLGGESSSQEALLLTVTPSGVPSAQNVSKTSLLAIASAQMRCVAIPQ